MGWLNRKRRAFATKSTTLLSLPPDVLRSIFLELYEHNKDWESDLAFFQASKVNRHLRAVALDIVETEHMDPVAHFLFTRKEWSIFLQDYSLTLFEGQYFVDNITEFTLDQEDLERADGQTHELVRKLIAVEDRELICVKLLTKCILGAELSEGQSALWKIQRWQKMVQVLKKES